MRKIAHARLDKGVPSSRLIAAAVVLRATELASRADFLRDP